MRCVKIIFVHYIKCSESAISQANIALWCVSWISASYIDLSVKKRPCHEFHEKHRALRALGVTRNS
jgi:hypothetical protein